MIIDNNENDREPTSQKQNELQEILIGRKLADVTSKRIIISIIVGIIVGFIESGIIPKSKEHWIILSIFIGIRIGTALTYAILKWKMIFFIKGIVLSILFTLPIFIVTHSSKYLQLILIASLSGLIISYGIERFNQKF